MHVNADRSVSPILSDSEILNKIESMLIKDNRKPIDKQFYNNPPKREIKNEEMNV
jgi:hypothetical protein